MATTVNVFGSAITGATLAGRGEYTARTVTRKDMAAVALERISGENNREGQQFTQTLKEGELSGGRISLGLLNNITGDVLTYVASHSLDGVNGPKTYPRAIQNGQVVAFTRPKTPGAAVVYRGKNEAGAESDWVLAWSNQTVDGSPLNKVHTEIHAPAAEYNGRAWEEIYEKVKQSGDNTATAAGNGLASTAAIGYGNVFIVEGTLYPDGLEV